MTLDHLKRCLPVIAATIFVLFFYLFIASRSYLWDRDEPRFAQATVEMIRSGNYLYPTFEGQLRPDKPILIYWLMSLAVKTFGSHEWAFRFFSCVGAASTCLSTYCIGRLLFNHRVGLWALAMLASTLMLSVMGTLATADAVLLAFTTSAMAVFTHAYTRQFRWWHAPTIGLLLGGALLTKGPPGLLPIPAMIAAWWWGGSHQSNNRNNRAFWLALLVATTLAILLFLLWAYPANLATNNQFLQQGIGHHVLDRMVSPHEGHGRNYLLLLPSYLFVIIAGFFPWTLHLPGGLSALIGKRLGNPQSRAFLLGWITPIFIIMSLVVTKLPHYILPIWPALAIIAAATIDASKRNQLSDWDRRWLRGGNWFFLPVALGLAILLAATPWLLNIQDLKWLGPIAACAILVWTFWAARLQLSENIRSSAALVLLGSILFQLFTWAVVVPKIEHSIKISPAIAQQIDDKIHQQIPIAVREYDEPSLLFYLGSRPIQKLKIDPDVIAWLHDPSPGVLIIPQYRLDLILQQTQPVSLHTITTVTAVNLNARAKPNQVVAVSKNLPN